MEPDWKTEQKSVLRSSVHEENKKWVKKDKGQKCLLVSGPINKCVQSIMGHKVEQWVWVQVQTETGTPAEYKGSKLSQHLSTHSWSLCTQGQSTGDRGGGVKRLFRYGLTMKKIKLARHMMDEWVWLNDLIQTFSQEAPHLCPAAACWRWSTWPGSTSSGLFGRSAASAISQNPSPGPAPAPHRWGLPAGRRPPCHPPGGKG